MTAGQLREMVDIERLSPQSDGMGGQATSWTVIATFAAAVKPLSGREVVRGMQIEASVTHRVIMRYTALVQPGDRLVLRTGQALNIRAVINVEMRDRWLEIMCDSGVAT